MNFFPEESKLDSSFYPFALCLAKSLMWERRLLMSECKVGGQTKWLRIWAGSHSP